VTLYLDSSVAKVFRAMGKEYQGRINRMLAMWVHTRAGGLLDLEQKLFDRFGKMVGQGGVAAPARNQGRARPPCSASPSHGVALWLALGNGQFDGRYLAALKVAVTGARMRNPRGWRCTAWGVDSV